MKPTSSIRKFIALTVLTIAFTQFTDAQIFEWANKIGGTSNEAGSFITADSYGYIYQTGYFQGTVDFDPGSGIVNLVSTGGQDGFLAKYTASGNFIWAFKVGGTGNDNGGFIKLDNMGHIYLIGAFQNTVDFDIDTGTFSLTSSGSNDSYVAKYDTAGNFIWVFKIGGIGNDGTGSMIINKAENNFYLSGNFRNTVDFDPDTSLAELTSFGNNDAFVAKYDTAGNYIWATKMGGTGSDASASILEDSLGNLLLTGNFNGTADFNPDTGVANLISAGSNDIFIAKYNSNGGYLWSMGLGGIGFDAGNAILNDIEGNIYLTGRFENTVDFDSSASNAFSLVSAGFEDIFILKCNAIGGFIWAFSIGGIYSETAYSALSDAFGNIYIGGNFGNTVDFDPGPSSSILSATGSFSDVFIAKYDTTGNYLWSIDWGGTLNDACLEIAIDSSGNIYASGLFQSTVDFDPGPGVSNLTSSGGEELFISKYSPCIFPSIMTPPQNITTCPNDTILFVVDAAGTEITYQWEVNEGTGFSTISNTFPYAGVTNDTLVITTYSGMNGYLYRCLITGSCAPVNTVISDSALLTVHPSYFYHADAIICSNDSVLIFGVYRNSAGTYYDSLVSVSGCDSVYEFTLIVNPSYAVLDTETICQGDSVLLFGTYQSSAGTYYDNYTTAFGCDSNFTSELIVNPLPNADIGPDTIWACNGQVYSFGIDTINQDISFYLIGNSQILVYDNSLTFTYNSTTPAPFVIAEVDGKNGCSSSDFIKLMNNSILSLNQNAPVINDPFVSFSANIPTIADSFYWTFGDGDTLSGVTNPTHEFLVNGNYTVCLFVENECGVDSDCVSISIIGVGIEETKLNQITIAPNPIKDVIYIKNIKTEAQISIFNSLGQLIYSGNASDKISIDISANKNGFYFIEIKNQNKSTTRREKILKIK